MPLPRVREEEVDDASKAPMRFSPSQFCETSVHLNSHSEVSQAGIGLCL